MWFHLLRFLHEITTSPLRLLTQNSFYVHPPPLPEVLLCSNEMQVKVACVTITPVRVTHELSKTNLLMSHRIRCPDDDHNMYKSTISTANGMSIGQLLFACHQNLAALVLLIRELNRRGWPELSKVPVQSMMHEMENQDKRCRMNVLYYSNEIPAVHVSPFQLFYSANCSLIDIE